MATRRVHVMVAEPSAVIRSGVVSVLESLDSLGIDIAEIRDMMSLRESLSEGVVDVVVVDPRQVGCMKSPRQLLKCEDNNVRFVALLSSVVDNEVLGWYDASFSIFDSLTTIEERLASVIKTTDNKETELTQREMEIVAAIARGASNKEIADQLFISTYTVMTHRRNISAKLNIHSPAGLTIYAIVNKLIDIQDVKG
ncbi:MAG: LuxR C-terminal-related transcriptional regulator [Rikenellaceae bacterium]